MLSRRATIHVQRSELRSTAGRPQQVGDAAGVGTAQPHLLAPGGVAADHLDVRPAQPELCGEQAGQGVVGTTALGSGGDLDLQRVAVPADDPGAGRPGLDVHGQQDVAAVVDPEGGHAAGYARPGRRPGNLVPMARDDEAEDDGAADADVRSSDAADGGAAADSDAANGGAAADGSADAAGGDLDDRVAAVYGGPLAAFVAERDALARELRSAGRRDEAAQVKKLRKPKLVAWALDAGAHADPGALAALVSAVDGLRGGQAGGDVRAAITALRAAEGPVVDAAAEAAGDHDQPVGRTTLAAAVRAVVGDPEALVALRAGRLADVPTGGGLGVPLAGPASPPGDGAAPAADRTATAAPPEPTGRPEPARRGAAARQEAAADRTQAARPGAAARRKEATRRKQSARRAVTEAERAARGAADAARRADRTARQAEAAAQDLRDKAAAAQRRADEAAEAAGQARREAEARAAARDRAEAAVNEARAALQALDG